VQVQPVPPALVTSLPDGTLYVAVTIPAVGAALAALVTPSWSTPCSPPTSGCCGTSVTLRSGPIGCTPVPEAVTGMVTGCALDGLACPSVVAVAVGEAVAAAPAGMDTAIATGGRLLPGAA
jgi:hypothetical protein